MKAFGATDDMYTIRINNRQLINLMMAQFLELDAVQAQLMIRLFDRKNKIPPQAFRDQAIEIFGEAAAPVGLQRIAQLLTARTMADLPESIRDSEAVRDVQRLFTLLERSGVTNAIFDITLMRGLDYYTGTVFEFFDTHPDNNRSLFGGGRYDGLVGMFGAEPISAVGFAPGLSMMQLFLEVHQLLPEFSSTTDIYMIVLGGAMRGALELADDLRDEDVNVEVDFTGRKLDKQLKAAIKKQIPYFLFVGEDELENEIYTLKNIATSESKSSAWSASSVPLRITVVSHRAVKMMTLIYRSITMCLCCNCSSSLLASRFARLAKHYIYACMLRSVACLFHTASDI